MTAKPLWKQIQEIAISRGLAAAATECLLWESPRTQSLEIFNSKTKEGLPTSWRVNVSAQLQGAYLLVIRRYSLPKTLTY